MTSSRRQAATARSSVIRAAPAFSLFSPGATASGPVTGAVVPDDPHGDQRPARG